MQRSLQRAFVKKDVWAHQSNLNRTSRARAQGLLFLKLSKPTNPVALNLWGKRKAEPKFSSDYTPNVHWERGADSLQLNKSLLSLYPEP
jgi:hypothetical protein